MDNSTLSLIFSASALLISLVTFYLWSTQRHTKKSKEAPFSTRPLQLQAYERLVILAERIALPNLVNRTNQPDLTAKEMQLLLLETIRQEFDYNSSQQIYVSPVAWQAITKLRDQNMMIINKLAQSLPPDANCADLNKKIMEISIAQEKNVLHKIVLEALNFEARKLMK